MKCLWPPNYETRSTAALEEHWSLLSQQIEELRRQRDYIGDILAARRAGSNR